MDDVPGTPVRLLDVSGFEDRKNDVIYIKPVTQSQPSVAIFFPGDTQDFLENMEAHRDNQRLKEWNLEATAKIIHNKFPNCHLLVVKASRMAYKTFAAYENFVRSSAVGVPEHAPNYNSLKHLNALINRAFKKLPETIKDVPDPESLDLNLIAFSKGCVVLNQFLYEFHHFKETEEDASVTKIIDRISNMYWLDGGHSGSKNTWVTDKTVLKTFCTLGITTHIHVSPYQVEDERRPWIKKECNAFSSFVQANSKASYTLHDKLYPISILTHFNVINRFTQNFIDTRS